MIELTSQGCAQVREWLLLLAADPAAPTWRPDETYFTPASLRAAADWLVGNGHGCGLDADVVAVLLASFSIGFQAQLADEVDGPADAQPTMLVSVSDLERALRERARKTG
jgi:hypothetical protein